HTRSDRDWSSDVCSSDLIIDAWATGSATTNPLQSAPVSLIAGSNYPVRVEFYETTGSATVHLRWQNPGTTSFASIPSANILHPRSEERRVGKECRSGWAG